VKHTQIWIAVTFWTTSFAGAQTIPRRNVRHFGAFSSVAKGNDLSVAGIFAEARSPTSHSCDGAAVERVSAGYGLFSLRRVKPVLEFLALGHNMDLRPRILYILSTFALAFFFTFPSVASAAETKKEPNPMADPAVQLGEATFKTTCQACHGVGATGGIGPNLIQSPIVGNQKKFKNQADLVIAQGRPDKGMPAFGSQLSASQISDVVVYLHALMKVNELRGGGNEAFLKQVLVGDAAAGKRYFYGQGGCSHCHSSAGDLDGIAKKYDAKALESEFLMPSQNNVMAKVTLPFGKQVEGTLLHQDPFYVAIQTKDGWYRSWPVDTVKVQVKDPLAAHRKLLSEYTNKDIYNVFAYLETLK